jgi:hypothetical protein
MRFSLMVQGLVAALWIAYDSFMYLYGTSNSGAKSDRARDGLSDGVIFANKRAEIWGAMREWLKGGSIPRDPELTEQLIGPEYTYNLRQEIQLERKEDMKKRGLASPDLGDALALTFAYPVIPHALAGGEGPNEPLVETEYNPFENAA